MIVPSIKDPVVEPFFLKWVSAEHYQGIFGALHTTVDLAIEALAIKWFNRLAELGVARFIDTLLVHAVEKGACFIPSVGNLGDGLIQLGTFDLLKEFGLAPQFKRFAPEALEGHKFAVMGGGGWVEGLWEDAARIFRPFLVEGRQLILLSSSASLCRFGNISLAQDNRLGPTSHSVSHTGSTDAHANSPSQEGMQVSSSETGLMNLQNELLSSGQLRREWFESEFLRLQGIVKEYDKTKQDLYTQIQLQRRRVLYYAAEVTAKQRRCAELEAKLKQLPKLEARLKQQSDLVSQLQREVKHYKSRARAFEGSRFYKAWHVYLKLYRLPVLGGLLRGMRKAAHGVIR